MAELTAKKRAALPDSAFAYIDSQGNRKLPIHDEAHVRNAMARFNQVRFESDEARERTFRKLLRAALGYGIAPIGFVAGEMRRARSPNRPDLPDGQVTLMFTDIEGSTDLLHRLGDDYQVLLEEVRTLLRDEVASWGGYEVDVRADDSFSVFSEARQALEAALSLQRRLHDRTWPVQVRVRIGLHSGSPERTDVGYAGMPVHTAARVCSVAHGGQVLLSPSTREELGEDLPSSARLVSVGVYRLRGLPRALELFQALGSDLSERFSPPRA